MSRRVRALLVDDDSDDRLLFRRALKKSGLGVDLFEATDGSAGINYLLGNERFGNRVKFPFPDLVILDLKMPGTDGFDVLKEIRKNMGLQNLPVLVFTNSDSKEDAVKAYTSHASAFHQKPFEADDLVTLLQKVIPLWLNGSAGGSEQKSP